MRLRWYKETVPHTGGGGETERTTGVRGGTGEQVGRRKRAETD